MREHDEWYDHDDGTKDGRVFTRVCLGYCQYCLSVCVSTHLVHTVASKHEQAQPFSQQLGDLHLNDAR